VFFTTSGRRGRRVSRELVLALLVTASTLAACTTTTPTAPSADTPAVVLGTASQETPSVPATLIPTPPQALGATRFMAFGDSITAGALSAFDGGFILGDVANAYPTLLQSMLNQYNAPQRFTVVNEGVPGETARVGVDRLPGELNTHQPQVVLLLEGINDLNFDVPVTQVANNVQYLVQTARLFNCTVLVATMPQTYYSVDPISGRVRYNSTEKIVPFNDEVRRLVSGLQNVHIVDIYSAFGSDRSLMGGDGLHPSVAGYQRMAQVFHQRISQIFPVRGSLQ
jgi:lysophospholipase L1-like esterase